MGRRTRGCCAGIERERGRDLVPPDLELEYKFEQNLIPNLSTLNLAVSQPLIMS